jgi:hypothetical protein
MTAIRSLSRLFAFIVKYRQQNHKKVSILLSTIHPVINAQSMLLKLPGSVSSQLMGHYLCVSCPGDKTKKYIVCVSKNLFRFSR